MPPVKPAHKLFDAVGLLVAGIMLVSAAMVPGLPIA
jgi:hypothetical protein